MVLYAKHLGCSATTLGFIAGMTAMMVVFQIPAARFVDRVGYKRFVLSGWSIRTLFVVLMTLVPLSAGWLPVGGRLAMLIVLLFFFNLSRGISSCGWLPWIVSIIPEKSLGRFLTLDSTMVNLASLAAFWVAAGTLGAEPRPWQFSTLFGIAAVSAVISLLFLRRIPEPARVDAAPAASARPPLREMLGVRPFRRLLVMNIGWSLANGGVLTFIVAYLKGMAGWTERDILLLVSLTFVGGLTNQLLMRRFLDRHGSKPVLITGCGIWAVLIAAWTLVAGGAFPHPMALLAVLAFGVGLASSMMNLSNLRLAMISAPERGRSHYFAMFSVVANVTLGVSPILWGMLVDACSELAMQFGEFELNRYSLLFGLVSLVFLVTLGLATRLIERDAASLQQLLVQAIGHSRMRYLLRPWLRMPPRP